MTNEELITAFGEKGEKRGYITHVGVLAEIDKAIAANDGGVSLRAVLDKYYTMCDGTLVKIESNPDPESEIKKPVTNITVDMNSSRAIFNWTPVKGQTKWYLMVNNTNGKPDFNRVVEKIPYTEEKDFNTGTYSITVKAIISGTSETDFVFGEPATTTHDYSKSTEGAKSVHASNQSIEIKNAEAQPKDNVVENQEPVSTMANKKQQAEEAEKKAQAQAVNAGKAPSTKKA